MRYMEERVNRIFYYSLGLEVLRTTTGILHDVTGMGDGQSLQGNSCMGCLRRLVGFNWDTVF